MIKRWGHIHVLTLFIIIATLSVWTLIYYQVPLFTKLQYWPWPFTQTPLKSPLYLLPVILLPFACYHIIKRIQTPFYRLLPIMILLGASYQFSLNFITGDYLDGLITIKKASGHYEFVKLAAHQPDISPLLRNYEDLVENYRERKNKEKESINTLTTSTTITNFDVIKLLFSGWHTKSKPPGLSLLYVTSEKLSQLFLAAKSYQERLKRLLTFMAVTWPFIAYLVLIPLFYFTKRVTDTDTAKLACLFYSIVPSINLMILHTDQTFFPLFLMTLLAISATLFSKKTPLWAVLPGILTYLIIYFSFGLLFSIPFVLALLYTTCFDSKTKSLAVLRLFKSLTYYTIGLLLTDLLFKVTLNYDILFRYTSALQNHSETRQWEWTMAIISEAGLTNIIEYVLFVGIPISTLAFIKSLKHIKTTVKQCLCLKYVTYDSLLPVLTLFIFLFLCFFSQTRSEGARLFLFLVPLVCILAAKETKHHFNTTPWLIPLCIGLQVGTSIILKLYQDFH